MGVLERPPTYHYMAMCVFLLIDEVVQDVRVGMYGQGFYKIKSIFKNEKFTEDLSRAHLPSFLFQVDFLENINFFRIQYISKYKISKTLQLVLVFGKRTLNIVTY
jgi:hypothetical protein